MTAIPPYIQRWCDKEGFHAPHRIGSRWYATKTNTMLRQAIPFTCEDLTLRDPPVWSESLEAFAVGAQRAFFEVGRSSQAEAIAAQLNAAIAQISLKSQAGTLLVQEGTALHTFLSRPCSEEKEPPETTDPLADAIGLVTRDYKMSRPIAALRLKEFAVQRRISLEALYKMLWRGQVRVRNGVLCEGKRFPKQRGVQHG